MGKMIGGGFPVGALAGRNDVMEIMNPQTDKYLFPLSGTFSANPVTMVAGRVSMELFTPAAVESLNRLADLTRERIAEAISIADISACVTGCGSMFRVHMKDCVPQNYRETFVTEREAQQTKLLLDHLFDNGIMLINTCSGTLSTPMTEKEIDILCEAMLGGFRKIKSMLTRENVA